MKKDKQSSRNQLKVNLILLFSEIIDKFGQYNSMSLYPKIFAIFQIFLNCDEQR